MPYLRTNSDPARLTLRGADLADAPDTAVPDAPRIRLAPWLSIDSSIDALIDDRSPFLIALVGPAFGGCRKPGVQ